jgi:hypothetical protein
MPAAGILAADGALFIRRSVSSDRSGAAGVTGRLARKGTRVRRRRSQRG